MDADPKVPPALPPPTPTVAEMFGAAPMPFVEDTAPLVMDGTTALRLAIDAAVTQDDPVPVVQPVAVDPAPLPPIEAGWKNPAWLSSHVAQLISLLALLGIFSQGDAANLSSWFGKAIAAAFVVIANVWMIARYFRHQVELHQVALASRKAAKNGSVKSVGWLIALFPLFLAGPAYAQPPARHVQTGLQIGLFNCCRPRQQQQQAAPQSDPAVVGALQQIASTNAQILGYLQAKGSLPPASPQQAPSPTPAPQLIILPQGGQQPYYGVTPGAPLYAPTPPAAPLYAPTPPSAPLYQPTPPSAPLYQPVQPSAPLYAPQSPGQPLITINQPGQPMIQIHGSPQQQAAPLYAPQIIQPPSVPAPTPPAAPPGITQPPSPTPPIGTARPVMPGASQLPPAATPQRYSYYYGRYVADPVPLVPVTQRRSR